MTHNNFLFFVEKTWNSNLIQGRADFVLNEKLKVLKGNLKSWNKEVFGIMDLEVEEAIKNLNDMDRLVADESWIDITIGVVNNRMEASKKVMELMNHKESMLR